MFSYYSSYFCCDTNFQVYEMILKNFSGDNIIFLFYSNGHFIYISFKRCNLFKFKLTQTVEKY